MVAETRRALRPHRRPRQQRRPLRLARDAAVHRDPARGVAARDGGQRRVDVPHLPRGRAGHARAGRRRDREHLVRARRSAACRSCCTTSPGRARSSRFTRALARELGKDGVHVNCVAPGFTMTEGVKAQPEVIEALRDVSVAARTMQRDQVPEDVVGAVVYLCAPAAELRHRPDDGHRRRPVLPLIFDAPRAPGRRRDGAGPRVVVRPRARRGAFVGAAARRDGARRSLAGRSTDPGAGDWVVRSTVSTSRPGRRLPSRPSGTGDPAHPVRRADDRPRRGARHTYRVPASAWFEGPTTRFSPRPRRREETAFVRVLLLPARVGGKADDPLRRSADDEPSRSCSEPRCSRGALGSERQAGGSSSTSSS